MWIMTDTEACPSIGIMEPRTIKSGGFNEEQFKGQERVKIRLLTDDEDISFTGEMTLHRLEEGYEGGPEDPFAPLDWAERDSGCTTLEYFQGGKWHIL